MGWYTEHVVDTGRAPALFALVGFVVTFVVVRSITRRIRARTEAAAATTTGVPGHEPADDGRRRRGGPSSGTCRSGASTCTTRCGASCSCC